MAEEGNPVHSSVISTACPLGAGDCNLHLVRPVSTNATNATNLSVGGAYRGEPPCLGVQAGDELPIVSSSWDSGRGENAGLLSPEDIEEIQEQLVGR